MLQPGSWLVAGTDGAPRPLWALTFIFCWCNHTKYYQSNIASYFIYNGGEAKLQRSQLFWLAPGAWKYLYNLEIFLTKMVGRDWGKVKCWWWILDEEAWVGKYNVWPPCQMITQTGGPPGEWQCDSEAARPVFIMFHIFTRPSPHYSLKCKSSQQPNMEDEHGLNRWLHLHTRHLLHFNYFDLEYTNSQPTPL